MYRQELSADVSWNVWKPARSWIVAGAVLLVLMGGPAAGLQGSGAETKTYVNTGVSADGCHTSDNTRCWVELVGRYCGSAAPLADELLGTEPSILCFEVEDLEAVIMPFDDLFGDSGVRYAAYALAVDVGSEVVTVVDEAVHCGYGHLALAEGRELADWVLVDMASTRDLANMDPCPAATTGTVTLLTYSQA